jgi:hypothetical protein
MLRLAWPLGEELQQTSHHPLQYLQSICLVKAKAIALASPQTARAIAIFSEIYFTELGHLNPDLSALDSGRENGQRLFRRNLA